MYYKFKYSHKHITQKNIINSYKLEHSINCNRIAFYKKEQKIPLEYYYNIHKDILKIYNKYKKNQDYNIIAVDGTYNNTNIMMLLMIFLLN